MMPSQFLTGYEGEVTEQNGHKAYPNGLARNRDSVQRGSVQFLSFARQHISLIPPHRWYMLAD